MWSNFTYEFPSMVIVAAMQEKIKALRAKIAERETRIKRLRDEYKITDVILIELLTQARASTKRGEHKMSYTVNSNTPRVQEIDAAVDETGVKPSAANEFVIGAGVVNNLMTEGDLAQSERDEVDRLSLIARNLRDVPDETISILDKDGNRVMRGHRLSEQEIRYLNL
jgi:hypothetical protein